MASVTFTIADADYPDFLEAFLLVHSVPLDPETQLPTMADNQWVKECGRAWYWNVYRQGRKMQRDQENPLVADPDIIT